VVCAILQGHTRAAPPGFHAVSKLTGAGKKFGLATPAGPGIPGGAASADLADRGARDAATWDPRRREESEARGGYLGFWAVNIARGR
jgi:hypothetical protein